jgi:hypothetical protein
METKEDYNMEEVQKSDDSDEEYLNYPSIISRKDQNTEQMKDIERKYFNILKDINSDSKRLGELLIQENTLIKDTCSCLTKILAHLNLAVILPRIPAPSFREYRQVILNSQGHLITVKKDDFVESKLLERYPVETILLVVWAVIPRIKEIVNTYTRQVSTRLDLFERIDEELKHVKESFEAYEGGSDMGVKDSIRENAREAIIRKK